jgi:transcriptional regulator with XRE-family HTH domain
MTLHKEDINELQLAALLANVTPVFRNGAGDRLAYMRMMLKMDQRQLGKLLGVSQRVISSIEKGQLVARTPISFESLVGIFGLRGVLYILCEMYKGQFGGRDVHTPYWQFKNAPKGDRKPFMSRRYGLAQEKRKNVLESEILELEQKREKLQAEAVQSLKDGRKKGEKFD